MTKDMISLGVDGGGTHTRAALVSGDGVVLGVGNAGTSNYDDVGLQSAAANVDLAVSEAWKKSGLAQRPADSCFLGMAGVRSDQDVAAILQIAQDLNLAAGSDTQVDHDIRIALAGGLAGAPGIALIAGTGSSCYGRAADGRHWTAGGWGSLDDLGSAWYLGMQAMVAAVQAYDGRGPSTVLQAEVCRMLALSDLTEILHRLHVAQIPRAQIAGLAPMVVQAAVEGDTAAREILARAAQELARMVCAVAKKLQMPVDVQVTTVGGLINNAPPYYDLLRGALAAKMPECRLVEPILPSVLGAALLALQRRGVALSAERLENLKKGAL